MQFLRKIFDSVFRRRPPAPIVVIPFEKLEASFAPVIAKLVEQAASYAKAAAECREATARHDQETEIMRVAINAGIVRMKARVELFNSRN